MLFPAKSQLNVSRRHGDHGRSEIGYPELMLEEESKPYLDTSCLHSVALE